MKITLDLDPREWEQIVDYLRARSARMRAAGLDKAEDVACVYFLEKLGERIDARLRRRRC